ncbi:hypothetical protein VTK73DRAFT_9272 [Phialemonium thermophilum]|uniref:Histone deacetylase complex subunit SAP30 Sin3 binding domain-containing protein n=1 Tax=Phialemonium thermophilum TaxID=223376 RepID=A0ABR3W3A6_9PEZI
MAPPKSSKNEEPKTDTPHATKDKTGHTASHSNGKLRRVASSTGANPREVTNVTPPAEDTQPTNGSSQEQSSLKLQWSLFQREVLHSYRRTYRLDTPTAFSSEYRRWVLSRPGSVGLHSPTMARRKELRRQSKDQLANTIRKHFNGLGVQENDVIVDFLHKVRSQAEAKHRKASMEDAMQEL